MIRTECRILVDEAEGRLEELVNRFLADGWRISHVSTTAVPSEDGATDHYITVMVERTVHLPEERDEESPEEARERERLETYAGVDTSTWNQ